MGLLAWTASVRAQCLTDNVMLDLPIENAASTDQSAFAHAVSVVGASYVNGQGGAVNGALSFAAASQYATIPADPAFEQMSDAFTIAAWIYPTTHLSENAIITKLNGNNRNFVFRFQDAGKLHFHYARTGGLTFITTDNPVVQLNQWQHVAATWDGNKIRLYLDGVLVKEQTITDEGPTFQAAGSIRLGTLNFGAERMQGYMDDVQMRSFAMAEGDIPCLMNHSLSLIDDLVLSLPLDDNSSTDVSSYANHGSITGSVAGPAENRFGNSTGSMQFTGTGNVIVQNEPQYNGLASGFTISAWIKPSSVSGNRVIVAKVGTGRDIVLRVDNGKFTVHYYVGGYVWFTPATATIVAGEWTNVACTWDGTTMTLFQDGEEIHSNQPGSSPNFTANNWNVGSLSNTGGENFGGQIDDVKIWSRALAPCELEENMYPALDLVVDDNLILCPGQNTIVETLGSLCSVLWTNDNSTEFFYDIEADDLGVGDHQIVIEAYDYYDNFYSDTVNVTVSLCTGIEESENTEIMNLYPNPASNVVTVNADGLSQIELLDVSGRMIQNLPVFNLKQADLNISNVPAGIYFVRITIHDGTVVSKRLIKH